MLILTDRAREGRAIYEYLTHGRRSEIVDLQQPETIPSPHPIIVCDAEIRDRNLAEAVRALLKGCRTGPDVPVLFLTRDSSNYTASLARSLGATELVHSGAPPSLILGVVENLTKTYSGDDAATKDIAVAAKARASDIKETLAACFGAARRRQPMSLPELNESATVLVTTIKTTKVNLWLDVVRQFDDATYQHCLIVAGLVAAFSLKLRLKPKQQILMSQAAILHDIGKARVPRSILNKAGPLWKSELDIMRAHAALGYDMLAGQAGIDPIVLDVTRHHHETLDGLGYPDRLEAAQISSHVRMVTICDIYAALIERRPYKEPMPAQQALGILADMGPKLDKGLLSSFEAMIADGG